MQVDFLNIVLSACQNIMLTMADLHVSTLQTPVKKID
ncbi:MAG: hypothetical protein ACI9FJ_000021 [Alteromonadaceae bacterium]|jgi:hypothetical protein